MRADADAISSSDSSLWEARFPDWAAGVPWPTPVVRLARFRSGWFSGDCRGECGSCLSIGVAGHVSLVAVGFGPAADASTVLNGRSSAGAEPPTATPVAEQLIVSNCLLLNGGTFSGLRATTGRNRLPIDTVPSLPVDVFDGDSWAPVSKPSKGVLGGAGLS